MAYTFLIFAISLIYGYIAVSINKGYVYIVKILFDIRDDLHITCWNVIK